jgi:hypothetical protein
MGIELVTGFIEHFQNVTTSNHSAIANSHINSSLQHLLIFLSLLYLRQSLPGNHFQWWILPSLWIPKPSSCFSYQILTATVHNG